MTYDMMKNVKKDLKLIQIRNMLHKQHVTCDTLDLHSHDFKRSFLDKIKKFQHKFEIKFTQHHEKKN